MRRLTVLALALALTLGLVLPAAAQTLNLQPAPNQYTNPGPGGVVQWSTASASCSNTTNECNFWGATPGSSFFATSPLTNQTPPTATTLPLHLQMQGRMHTAAAGQQNSAGPISVGINYGGSAASLSLVNNFLVPVSQLNVPVQIDVWLSPIATGTAPGNTTFIKARMTLGSSQGASYATESVFNAVTVGTQATASPTALNVIWRWGSAAQTNAVQFYQRKLMIGE